jgi:hypothetical protein
MIYPVRLVSALPLVFSVGAVHDSVTLVGDVAPPEEPEPLVAPLDELPEPEATGVEVTGVLATGVEVTGVEVTGVEATGVEVTGVEITGLEVTGVVATGVAATGVEAIGVLLTLLVGGVPALGGGVTAAASLASPAEPALCVEPPHPASRTTEMSIEPRIWAMSFQRRSIFMCIRLAKWLKAVKALWRLRIDRREAD